LLIAFFGEARLQPDDNSNFILGSILILVCAFTYASYIVGSGRLIPLVGASKFNSYAMSFASIGVLLHFFITSDVPLWNFPATVYIYSFSMAILSTVIPSYLITEGIKRVGSDNVAIVASIGPVSTIAMAYFFLDEPVFFAQMVGTILILLGVLLVSKQKRKIL
jgi:drug/metabolite transporter (DMT)-like permease